MTWQDSRLQQGAGPSDASPQSVQPRGDGFLICATLVVLATIFQKIAIPGSSGALPVSTLGLVGVSIAGLLLRQLVVVMPAAGALLLFVFVASLSFVTSDSPELSFSSLAFLLAVQFPLALRLWPEAVDYERLLGFTNALLTSLALCGIAQFALQFVVGHELPYLLDLRTPAAFFLEGYNRLNALTFGSPYYKSNGVFMAEPSFFCQFLALGLVIEATSRARPIRLVIYLVAIGFSFSGTGLLMLALCTPIYLVQSGGIGLMMAVAAASLVGFVVLDAAGLTFLTDRVTEFSSPGSSGFARFVSPFVYIDRWMLSDPVAIWIGRGPGTVMEHFGDLPWEAFPPTWAKIFYEYGILGSACYVAFVGLAIGSGLRRTLAAPLFVTYLLLGGYSANPFIVSLLAVFLAWPASQPCLAGEPAEKRKTGVPSSLACEADARLGRHGRSNRREAPHSVTRGRTEAGPAS